MLRSSLPISSQSPGVGAEGIRRTKKDVRLVTLAFVVGGAFTLGGCGVAEPEPEAAVKPVQLEVSPMKFSKTKQVTGDDVTLSVTIKNVGENPAPGLLVQLEGLDETTIANPFDEGRLRTTPDDLPDAVTRAAWFVDGAPDRTPLSNSFLYPGGRLDPGRTRTLKWEMAATTAGDHELKYRVFAGLTDNAAKATSGEGLTGTVKAKITDR